MMGGILLQAFIYLCAAVLAVPLAKRLGLGSVLGYLLAGILIGPVFGFVGAETQSLQQFAELGVVMMLFLIGLELQPQKLWAMRNRLVGLGGLQLLLTTAVFTGIGMWSQLYWGSALALGFTLALSSTAIVLQTLQEKGLTQTAGGRAGFSVLLFQDIAVIPVLALLPLLRMPGHEAMDSSHASAADTLSLVAGLPAWANALVVLAAVATLVLGGHFLTRPLFRFIAGARMREIFTAAALMLVIGITVLMSLVNLSPALGAFIAGVVLADSEFRHELESDIEPFKGLLLGLFFITVGAGIDFRMLSEKLDLVMVLTLGILVIKALLLWLIARIFRLPRNERWLFSLALAQAGEFGFLLLTFSADQGVIPQDLAKILAVVVAMTMLATPGLFILLEKVIIPLLDSVKSRRTPDPIEEQGTVVIAGIGRFGQIINRLLVASKVPTVVLDHAASRVEALRQVGIKTYYGDASRPDLLAAAGLDNARLFVVAIDDRDRAVAMVSYVHRHYPSVRILARAQDAYHLYLLKRAGADIVVRETLASSLELGREALVALGTHPYKAERMARAFRRHDEEGIDQLCTVWDEHGDLSERRVYLTRVQERVGSLQQLMNSDRLQLHDRTEDGWTPPSPTSEFHEDSESSMSEVDTETEKARIADAVSRQRSR